MDEILNRLAQAIIDQDVAAAETAAREALAAGIPPLVAMNNGATKGMDVVGQKYEAFEFFLPELMLAGNAMKAAVAVLLEALPKDEKESLQRGKVVIGTVAGDIHDIGKNIVAAMLASNGFAVYDLGVGVEPIVFFRKAQEVNADIIALSTLLTTSMPFQQDVIGYLNDSNSRQKHFVIIGGGPVTPEWTAEMGADGYGRTAFHAVELCKQLIESGLKPPLAKPMIVGISKE